RLLGARAGAAAADQVSELVELRPHLGTGRIAVAFARVEFEEQAVRDLGARAAEACKRDRPVSVLERELDADAERGAVLRAVASAGEPLRGGLLEGRLEW